MGKRLHYLKIDGIIGNATEVNHKNWIDVIAWNILSPYGSNRSYRVDNFDRGILACILDSTNPSAVKLYTMNYYRLISQAKMDTFDEVIGKYIQIIFKTLSLTQHDISADTVTLVYEFESAVNHHGTYIMTPFDPKFKRLMHEPVHSQTKKPSNFR